MHRIGLACDVKKSAPSVPPAEPSGTDLSKLTVAELRKYAKDNGIDLGAATTKADIITIIADVMAVD